MAGLDYGPRMAATDATPSFSVSCPCGVAIRGTTFDDLVASVDEHARNVHDMVMSREQVREMMSIDGL